MSQKSVAVFCGSREGDFPIYTSHAIQLGKILARKQMTIIYGGGKRGLMGALSVTAMKHGGTVIGVIPDFLLQKGHTNTDITELRIVSDMHERKKLMYELCNMAIVLPGGLGTMDELFEMITWNSLKIHDKKIVLLNSGNYYQPLINLLDEMQSSMFLHENWRERITVVDSPEKIFQAAPVVAASVK